MTTQNHPGDRPANGINWVTDAHEGDLVVFLLGMRPHATWRIDQMLFVNRSVLKMKKEIERDRAAGGAIGYLGGFGAATTFGPVFVQYWRSFGELENYANGADFEHRPAWLKIYAMTHKSGSSRVGLWHETYRVTADSYESIYAGTGKIALGAAVGLQPLSRRGHSSRDRLDARRRSKPADA